MKSPADMNIIQIDITNDCFNRCSNCSGFSGNHKKNYYMDWDTFKRACESLHTKQFKGMIGIMGGEPTLHPDFDRMVRYYDTVAPRGWHYEPDINVPIDDINKYQQIFWGLYGDDGLLKRRGLWTSLGPGYIKHFELIRNVFEYQCINDHKSSIIHQVSMLTRKELEIPDDKWEVLRDNCWLQNNWSASITPKGAFFCEIAGAMDMLFDGPGGWKIEAGWWNRTPKEFGDQLNWCEMCSFCLKTPYVQSHTDTDVVSPVWNHKLEEIGSKKTRKIFDISNYNPEMYIMSDKKKEPYIEDSDTLKRVGVNTTKYLSLNKIIMVMVCCGYSHVLKDTLAYNKGETDGIVVVTDETDIETQKVCKELNVYVHISYRKSINGSFFNKGAMLNEGIDIATKYYHSNWILLSDADVVLPFGFKDTWNKKILNPGTLYYAERINIKHKDLIKCIVNPNRVKEMILEFPHANQQPWGYFQLFNINAEALQGRDTIYSEDYLSAGYVDGEFIRLWHKDRRYFTGVRVLHIEHGPLGVNWNGVPNNYTNPV
jgi:hypothetical protein